MSLPVEEACRAAAAIRAICRWKDLARMARQLTRRSALAGTPPATTTRDLAVVPGGKTPIRPPIITLLATRVVCASAEATRESVPEAIVRPLLRGRCCQSLVRRTNISARHIIPWLWHAADRLHGSLRRACQPRLLRWRAFAYVQHPPRCIFRRI